MTNAGRTSTRSVQPESSDHTLTLDRYNRITAASDGVPAFFAGRQLVGLSMTDIVPTYHEAALGRVIARTMRERVPAVVMVPSAVHPDKMVWARVTPEPHGGASLRFRFHSADGHKALAHKTACLLLPLIALVIAA